MDGTNGALGLDQAWSHVLEFHQRLKFPIADRPAFLTRPRAKQRGLWMLEELTEFLEATNLVDQTDALIDLMYFALGTLVEMGVRPDGPFAIVHAANLAKAPRGTEGVDPGKAVKGADWQDPRELMMAELKRQRRRAARLARKERQS